MKLLRLVVLLLAISGKAPASRLDDALDLEAQGRFKEAKDLLVSVIAESRASGDSRSLAQSLSASGRVSISLGDYRGAIQRAYEAIAERNKAKEEVALSEDYNTLGLANLYLGNYDAALSNYQRALELDRRHHSAEAEISRLNNIGNIYYFRGRYQEALRTYQEAMDRLVAAGGQPWVPRRRQLTVANLAALYQRLGKEQAALELYGQLTRTPQALPRSEYAQLLLNEGVLYRRLGDPVKALERYGAAQSIFATEHHRDGEIGALRNIGIARALDLGDLAGAHQAFNAALRLAKESSDTRGIVQSTLYRGEVLRRLGRFREATDDLRQALEGAQNAGLAEELWKAQYGLAKLAEAEGHGDTAGQLYRQALAGIESVRAGIRRTALRGEFLADKRDVYDSLIALLLRQSSPPLDEIFSLMEHSRARTLEERDSTIQLKELSISEVCAGLAPESVFLEFWAGESGLAALWISPTGRGVAQFEATERSLTDFARALESGDAGWRLQSRELGRELLANLPRARHIIAAPDGGFALLPLEALTWPATGRLVIEDAGVSYLPAARFLHHGAQPSPLPPWRTQFLGFGAPPVTDADTLGAGQEWQPLTAAADEIQSIAHLLPGRAAVFLGTEARKHDLLSQPIAGISLLHFATHAVVDAENPDRSRVLMAGDYLFQQEVYGLNLHGVDLATISACETARGKVIRGDGPQAFSQAFLAAGAAATVTSLWPVGDRPTAEFMKQFYYYLSQGQAKAEALRSAKVAFLNSRSAWAGPRYWSAFVLNGDGWDHCRRVIPWSWLLTAGGVAVGMVAIGVRISRSSPGLRSGDGGGEGSYSAG